MWYAKNPEGFERDELLSLYRVVDQRERAFREDLFRFTNFYSAVCFAILGITLSGFVNLYKQGLILLALSFGPALTLCMCYLGLAVTGRIYHRIVEEISVKAKLENALGLDRPLQVKEYLGEKNIWEQDNCLLAPRHATRRTQDPCSDDFIKASGVKGFARDNRFYFGIIAAFSVLLEGVILVTSFVKF